ncbi:hypothetical protein P7K49_027948 [Saguinus oedipus]|uniref:Uncharacterized protein n=1 Tax=Saguinus oedipus TaxID=9490 RepID=A0ABQ9UBR1_SAGOE|nr:hypothetical protein P7K49_027948 [Saguinus oedipus]
MAARELRKEGPEAGRGLQHVEARRRAPRLGSAVPSAPGLGASLRFLQCPPAHCCCNTLQPHASVSGIPFSFERPLRLKAWPPGRCHWFAGFCIFLRFAIGASPCSRDLSIRHAAPVFVLPLQNH